MLLDSLWLFVINIQSLQKGQSDYIIFLLLAAVMTAFLPCVTFGQIAEVLDGGEMGKIPLFFVIF